MLACDFTRLGEELRAAQRGGADTIHVDVMDGHFVPNISFGVPLLQAARRACDLPMDVHLMIEAPERYLEAFASAGASGLTLHAEANPHLHRALSQVRELGLKAGAAVNPATPLEALRPAIEEGLCDLVLIMSVNPGFGGQKFIEHSLRRVSGLRAMLDAAGSTAALQVDGGVTAHNAAALAQAGATNLVAGSAVFGPQGAEAGLAALREALAEDSA